MSYQSKENTDFTTSFIPAGFIMMWAGEVLPNGWLRCDGSEIEVSNYRNLFVSIGYKYGGSGAVFNVPDLRGRTPMGYDFQVPLASYVGEEYHSLTSEEINHGHLCGANSSVNDDNAMFFDADSSNYRHTVNVDWNGKWFPGNVDTRVYKTWSNAQNNLYFFTDKASMSQNNQTQAFIAVEHENCQPYMALKYIIKS